MQIPKQLEFLMELYDLGSLPPDEQIELAQGLIDYGLVDDLRQYQPLCDYFIAEGLCYVPMTSFDKNNRWILDVSAEIYTMEFEHLDPTNETRTTPNKR